MDTTIVSGGPQGVVVSCICNAIPQTRFDLKGGGLIIDRPWALIYNICSTTGFIQTYSPDLTHAVC